MRHHHRFLSWRRSSGCLLVLGLWLAGCGPAPHGGPADAPTAPIDANANPPDASPPGFGLPCTTAADCPTGLCVSGTDQNYCTIQCDKNCPQGFSCRVTEVDGTYQSVCLPPIVQVCAPCTTSADCGGGACVPVGGGGDKFCLEACFEGACPDGYTCTEDPDGNHPGVSFCVPASCDCRPDQAGQVRTCSNTNAFGTCYGTEVCDPTNGGWQGCNAPTASTEVCDGTDNNCNMLIDEGTGGQACDNTNADGTCPGTTLCTGAGGLVCQGKTPAAETCNGADDDCDTMIDEGFAGLGTVCSAGDGACKRFGVEQCSADGTSVVCSATAGNPTGELCNALDDDCDGSVDEDFPTVGSQCTNGAGQCARIGTTICTADGSGTTCSATPGAPTTELCNLLDDDCDGGIDEDFKDNGVYDKDTACGSCTVDCTSIYALPNAYGTCDATGAPTCKMSCNPGDFDLNGAVADGCEFVLDPDAIYVSTSDPGSADDPGCGLGPVGTGSGNHPCKTIAQGIARADMLGRARVLVANGLYSEAVTVSNGRSLLGGYDWETWQRDVAATGTLIAGVSSSGNHDRTVIATNITSATTIEGFVIYGSVNNKAGGNSYAIYVSGSNASLQIVNNIIFGGRGGPGANGANGADGTIGAAGAGRNPNLTVADSAYDAKDATGSGECNTSSNRQYANGGTRTCGGTSVNGGAGGGNRCPVQSYCDTGGIYGCQNGTQYFHWSEYTAIDGAAGQAGGGANGGAAGAGAYAGDDGIQVYGSYFGGYVCYLPTDTDGDGNATYGLDGSDGGNGQHGPGVGGCTANIGAVVGGQWVGGAAPGGNGGGNGGGGGGGGAGGGGKCQATPGATGCTDGGGKDTLGGHGGGGGSGGCGGAGGGAASSGGGAFDVFIVGGTAAPIVTGNTLFRGSGGVGGTGGAGGTGGTGGLGAPGGTTGVPVIFCTDTAGRGGNGGDGGDGSGGGGGCGGSSYGIYTSGVGTPNYCQAAANNTISTGGAGSGGPGGYSIINPGGAGVAGVLTTCSFN